MAAPALRRHLHLVTVVTIIYGALLTAIGIVRHHNFWSRTLDMGVFDQGEWLVAHGHAHLTLLDRNLFSDHVSFVYLPIAALYRLWPSVSVLIVVQSIALACSVYPHLRLARSQGFSERIALFVAVANGAFLNAGIFDFHSSVLAVPFVLWALVAIAEDRPRLLYAMAFAILLCRAEMVVFVIAFMVMSKRSTWLPLGVLSIAALVAQALPSFFGGGGLWSIFYTNLGSSPGDALLHPWRIVRALFRLDALQSLCLWLLPFGFVSLLSPRRMLAVLIAGFPILLAPNPQLHVPWFHYGATLEPFVFFAMLDPGVRKWISVQRVQWIALTMSVVSFVCLSPVSWMAPDEYRVWNVMTPMKGGDFDAIVDAVPKGAAVSAVNPFVSHLSQRQFVFEWPTPYVDTRPLGPDVSVRDQQRLTYVVIRAVDESVARARGFDVEVLRSGDYLVLKRR